jgi:hypothetical protein
MAKSADNAECAYGEVAIGEYRVVRACCLDNMQYREPWEWDDIDQLSDQDYYNLLEHV